MSVLTQTKNGFCLARSLPMFQVQKRHNTREAIHRYVEPDKFKKHMLSASEPYFKRKYLLQSDICKGHTSRVIELHPLQKIYSNELLKAVEENDFTLLIQHNYTPFQSERVYKNTIIKSGGHFYSHRNEVYREVFNRLGVDRLQPLFVTRNSLILGPTEALGKCVLALRRMPQFLLLAGYIDKEVYTYEQLQLISLDSNLDSCRANLLSTLETPAIELSQNLEKYVEINSAELGNESSEQSAQDHGDPKDTEDK